MNIHVAHDPILVGFALLIAILAAFTALNLGARAQENEGNVRLLWLSMAAMAMGGGVFTMHFIAMLACDMGELLIAYKVGMMLSAVGVAVVCSAIALAVTFKYGSGPIPILIGGLFMGLGIAGMHYLGAASMVLAAIAIHKPLYVTISIIISVFASMIALWLTLNARTLLTRLASAVAMCTGIAGMHFVGIGATYYEMLPDVTIPPAHGLPPVVLAVVVGIATIALLALGLTSALVDQHLSHRARKASERLREAYEELEVKVEERTSELRYAKEAAEAGNLAKSRFLATMSHELRTPFNAIMGFTQVLQQKMKSDDDTEALDILNNIEEASEHLLGLVDELLDLARIESGKATLSPKPVQLSGLIKGVETMVRPLIEKNGNAFAIEGGEDIRLITVDVKKTRQCLINILSNAAKFTTDGRVTLSVTQKDDMLQFDVSDTGIGLSEQDQDKVFDTFVQVDDALSRHYEGAGLGLAITRQLCHLMGGEILVKSALSQGAIFCFTIKADQMPLMNMELAPQQSVLRRHL